MRIDDDGVAFFADNGCLDDGIIDALDPQRATYQSWRVLERPTAFGGPATFLNDARFGMPAYTAELKIAVPQIAGVSIAHGEGGFYDASFCAGGEPDDALAFIFDAVIAGAALRDDLLIDLDIPTRRSLRHVRRFADLQLR